MTQSTAFRTEWDKLFIGGVGGAVDVRRHRGALAGRGELVGRVPLTSEAERIRTGTYAVNMYAFDPGAPFGGYQYSGIGRENGPEGIEACCEAESVLLPFGFTP